MFLKVNGQSGWSEKKTKYVNWIFVILGTKNS